MSNDPTGWQDNGDGTFSPPGISANQNWKDVPPNVQRTIIKDGALIVYDANGVERALLGKDGTSFDVEIFDSNGANPVKMSTLAQGGQAQTLVSVGTGRITSSSYGDLSGETVGPAVTANVGPSGRLLVSISNDILYTNSDTDGFMSINVAGPTNIGPSTIEVNKGGALHISLSTGGAFTVALNFGKSYLLSGLAQGAYTITAKYRGTSNVTATYQFVSRTLVAQPY